VEDLVTRFRSAFRGRRVLVTGHTGFKGSWLTWWLHRLGSEVTGYALAPDRSSMFQAMELASVCHSLIGDVRDRDGLATVVERVRPEYVFHLAAQSLVLASYDDPLGTIATNVMGTANLLEVLRVAGKPVVAVVVTSDKCYENRGAGLPFREGEPLGGRDIYSMSKAAAELVVASYRSSFLTESSPIRVSTARAGNVMGGGDWAADRLVPDCVRSLAAGKPIPIRNPAFVRPWQHVLEPLSGYLLLSSRMEERGELCDAWNFGPLESDAWSVEELVTAVVGAWGSGSWVVQNAPQRHEAPTLRLSIQKATERLGWKPRWSVATAVEKTVQWYKEQTGRATPARLRALTDEQIASYLMRDSSDAS